MTRKEYAAKYGVSLRVMRKFNIGQLDAASEEARELLMRMSKRTLPTSRDVRANMSRMSDAYRAQRAGRRFAAAMSDYSDRCRSRKGWLMAPLRKVGPNW